MGVVHLIKARLVKVVLLAAVQVATAALVKNHHPLHLCNKGLLLLLAQNQLCRLEVKTRLPYRLKLRLALHFHLSIRLVLQSLAQRQQIIAIKSLGQRLGLMESHQDQDHKSIQQAARWTLRKTPILARTRTSRNQLYQPRNQLHQSLQQAMIRTILIERVRQYLHQKILVTLHPHKIIQNHL